MTPIKFSKLSARNLPSRPAIGSSISSSTRNLHIFNQTTYIYKDKRKNLTRNGLKGTKHERYGRVNAGWQLKGH